MKWIDSLIDFVQPVYVSVFQVRDLMRGAARGNCNKQCLAEKLADKA
jgi:hypothetical protein